jgi:hypothetical protein
MLRNKKNELIKTLNPDWKDLSEEVKIGMIRIGKNNPEWARRHPEILHPDRYLEVIGTPE